MVVSIRLKTYSIVRPNLDHFHQEGNKKTMCPTTNPILLMSIYVKPHSPNTCQNVWEINHVCTKTLQNRCANLNLLSSSSRSSRSFLSFFSFFSFLLFFSSRLLPLTQWHHQHILRTFIKQKHMNSNINNNARKQRELSEKKQPSQQSHQKKQKQWTITTTPHQSTNQTSSLLCYTLIGNPKKSVCIMHEAIAVVVLHNFQHEKLPPIPCDRLGQAKVPSSLSCLSSSLAAPNAVMWWWHGWMVVAT